MPRQLKLPPHPDAPLVDGSSWRMISAWYAWLSEFVNALLNRVPITGSVTFAAATTATVTFATAEANATYRVWFSSPEDNYFWTTSPTVNGFTINAKNSSSATVGWQLIRP